MRGSPFNRRARTYPLPLPSDPFPIPLPPPLNQSGVAAWLQYLFPLVGSLSGIVFVVIYHNLLVLVTSGLVALFSVGIGVVMNLQRRREAKRQAQRYSSWLKAQRVELGHLASTQRQFWTELYPPPAEVAALISKEERRWERRPGDADFLEVRLGIGTIPLCREIQLEPATYEKDYDSKLLRDAQRLATDYALVSDCPVHVSLRSIGALTISGDRAAARKLIRSLLCQVASFHAPGDVRLVALYQPQVAPEWAWLKWLPHTRRLSQAEPDEKAFGEPLCMLAETPEEGNAILAKQISRELAQRRKLRADQKDAAALTLLPHLVVVIDGFTQGQPVGQHPILRDLFRDAATLGVTILCLIDNPKEEEPETTQARIEVTGPDGWLRFEETTPQGRRIEGARPDAVDLESAEQVARMLAPLTLGNEAGKRDLAQDIRLLELLHIPSLDELSALETWEPRAPQDVLRVPIGLGDDGQPLLLDLKQPADGGVGPHGLVVGGTGSGKSELLMTLVTGLAITHPPSQLNFVLVDFKGGATIADLAALPHVAGTITDLENNDALIDRTYKLLQGEVDRRKQMLAKAGHLNTVTAYQAKQRTTPGMEPLPYLLIIVDEIAELIAAYPEFLDLFKSIGRVGRSLGMHLLLAPQLIDEGRMQAIEGHLGYRICLRTNNASESSTVLGVPDAYYLPLPIPGIGYFKGGAETHRKFKSAIITRPYVPPVDVDQQRHLLDAVLNFTPTGKLLPFPPDNFDLQRAANAQNGHAREVIKEVSKVVKHLAHNPLVQGQPPVHPVLLPPLEPTIPLASVLAQANLKALNGSFWPAVPAKGPMKIPIGLLDKPREQEQKPFFLDFSGPGGHLAVVGAPKSGKSTLLRTIITSFMLTHSPRDVQLYCVDLGGGLLQAFETAPHVGAVCGIHERDKIRRLIRRMSTLIAERELFFPTHGIDSMVAYRERRRAGEGERQKLPFGDVFLIIDDLKRLRDEFPDLEPEISAIIASGLTYGVHVILTAGRWIDIPPKDRPNIGQRLQLRLHDANDSEFGKAATRLLAAGLPGRGLVKEDEESLLFQTALPIIGKESTSDQEIQQSLTNLVSTSRAAWKEPPAPPILLLPEKISRQALPAPTASTPRGVPIGVEETQLEPVYVDLITNGPHFLIFGDAECGKTTLLRTWMRGLEERYTPQQVRFAIIDERMGLADFVGNPHLLQYAYTSASIKECIGTFKDALEERKQESYQKILQQAREPKTWGGPHWFLFVDDYDPLASTGNPLNALVDALPQTRNLGIHFVIARRVQGTGKAAFMDSFMGGLKNMNTPCLVMSGDPNESLLLETQKASRLPPGRGKLYRGNKGALLMQIAYSEPPPKTAPTT